MDGNSTTEAIKQEHDRNEHHLEALAKDVDRVTSPPSAASPTTDARPPSSKKSGTTSTSHSGSGSGVSPSQIAASLFNRSKPKSKAKSKGGKRSKDSTPPNGRVQASAASASAVQLDGLERDVEQTKQNELNLVSSAVGVSPNGAVINENGDDEVLDLADQLLAQLDAKRAEEKEAQHQTQDRGRPAPAAAAAANGAPSAPIPIPAAGRGSTMNTPVAQPRPVPIPGSNGYASGAPLAADVSRSISTSPTPSTSTTNTATSRSSLGSRIKKAFSPDSTTSVSSDGTTAPGPTKNRHALRKEKKQREDEAMRAEARAEVDAAARNGNRDPAVVEKEGFDRIRRQWHLEMHEVEPDGHCMYSAIADQLGVRKGIKKLSYHDTRKAAASYMREHVDDFLPFMTAEDEEGGDDGDGLLTPEGYQKHCNSVESTGEWGGQTEILALSKYYKVPIYVFQANSPLVRVGMEEPYAKTSTPLMISYHRRQYGLGQHYNSLRPAAPQSEIVMMSG